MRVTRMTPLILAALLLAGCHKKEDPAARPPPRRMGAPDTAEATVQLDFWHIMNYSGPKEVLAAAVKRFEQANPGTSVTIQTFDNDAYKTKLAIEMASGTPPDVFFTWGGGGLATFAEAGRVVDLTDALARNAWRERFLDSALGICTSNGRVFAVPLDLSCVLVWYNAQLFAARNLVPPETYAELTELCSALRGAGITPFALGNMKQWPGAFYFVYLAAREGGAQLFFDAAAGQAGAVFDHPAFVRAGERLRQLVELKAFPTGFNGVDTAQARTQFLTGKAAMYVMGTWLVARVKGEAPDFLPQMSCFAFPRTASGAGAPDTVVGGVNCGFAVSKACRHPDEAVELLRFLTDDEIARAWCGIGRIPSLQVGEDALAQLPVPTRAALSHLESATMLQPYYDQYLPPRLAEMHKKTTQELFAGTMSPAEAATRMAQSAAEQLGKAAQE